MRMHRQDFEAMQKHIYGRGVVLFVIYIVQKGRRHFVQYKPPHDCPKYAKSDRSLIAGSPAAGSLSGSITS